MQINIWLRVGYIFLLGTQFVRLERGLQVV